MTLGAISVWRPKPCSTEFALGELHFFTYRGVTPSNIVARNVGKHVAELHELKVSML